MRSDAQGASVAFFCSSEDMKLALIYLIESEHQLHNWQRLMCCKVYATIIKRTLKVITVTNFHATFGRLLRRDVDSQILRGILT